MKNAMKVTNPNFAYNEQPKRAEQAEMPFEKYARKSSKDHQDREDKKGRNSPIPQTGNLNLPIVPLKGDKSSKTTSSVKTNEVQEKGPRIICEKSKYLMSGLEKPKMQDSQGFIPIGASDAIKIQKGMLTQREDILKLITELYKSHVEGECKSLDRWRFLYGAIKDELLTDKDKLPLMLVATNLHKELQILDKTLLQFNVEEDIVRDPYKNWSKKLLNEWEKYEVAACKKMLQDAGVKEDAIKKISLQVYRIWMYYWYSRTKEAKEVTDIMMKDSLVFKMLIMRIFLMSERYKIAMKDEIRKVNERQELEQSIIDIYEERYKEADSTVLTYRIFKLLMNEFKLINLISEKTKKEMYLDEIILKFDSEKQKLLNSEANTSDFIMRKGLEAYRSLTDTDVMLFTLLGYKTVVYSILHHLEDFKDGVAFSASTITSCFVKSIDVDVLKILFNVKE